MITTDVQIHGYRKGHQLLASSLTLPKDDQAVIDRLSDVAGPLRPRELFAPYLSAYPLPSGSHYVIARTWQDLTVSRAGCVRTKSLLLDANVWSRSAPLVPILRLLSSADLPTENDAVRLNVHDDWDGSLAKTPEFNSNELLEALFLEGAKPVAVFDAPDPELIASRLLVALWPEVRRRFSVTTFALSPRKFCGRDFDLVFTLLSAKSKFSDWQGRRVDGRFQTLGRHRWTNKLVRRVFHDAVPKLLSEQESDLLSGGRKDASSLLRIALLWDELVEKLDQTPTVSLGLLDIANSGLINNEAVVRSLEPRLVSAARKAANVLSSGDGWDFVGAIARKIKKYDMPIGKSEVFNLAQILSQREPGGAVSLMQQPDPNDELCELIPSIANGLANGSSPQVEQILLNAPSAVIVQLLSEGGGLAQRILGDDHLVDRVGTILVEVDSALLQKAEMALLPLLVEDRLLPVALPVFGRLDMPGVVSQLQRIRGFNNFKAQRLSKALIDQASRVGGLPEAREVLIEAAYSKRRSSLLERTVAPIEIDIIWILFEDRLSDKEIASILFQVLRRASDKEFSKLLSNPSIEFRLIAHLLHGAEELLMRAVLLDSLPIDTRVRLVQAAMQKVSEERQFVIAEHSIPIFLCSHFEGDEISFLLMLLGSVGERLNGDCVTRAGLGLGCDASIVNRNLVLFDMAPAPARWRMLESIDEIARILGERNFIDLNEAAYDACARLVFDAEVEFSASVVSAAERLMPSLLKAKFQPVSLLIAALFPKIYSELENGNNTPYYLSAFSFFDWDRCSSARRELVAAFMGSYWHAGDLALTGCRCGDIERILKRVAESNGGESYLVKIENDLSRLNEPAQNMVLSAIAGIRSDRSNFFDW